MDYKEIKLLLHKYMEGDTTLEEEALLKKYFTETEHIPNELEYAKGMFLYFKAESKTEAPELNYALTSKKRTPYLSYIVGVAASILLAVGCFFYMNQNTDQVVYAYVNGQPQTNQELAIAETKRALLLVSNRLNQGTKDLAYISKFNEAEQIVRRD